MRSHPAAERAFTTCGAIFLAGSVLLAGAEGSAADRLFEGPIVLPLEGASRDIVQDDLDGDGTLDIALCHGSEVAVLLGRAGDDVPREPVRYPVGPSSVSLAAGDLDGDGLLDVAVACSGASSVNVLSGGGAPLFDAVHYPAGLSPRLVRLADLNRDGKLDLVTADFESTSAGTMTVLLGSDGTLVPAGTLVLDDNAHGFVLEDFDADGIPDIALGYREEELSLGTVSWHRGAGDGKFAPARKTVVEPGADQFPRLVETGDLDGSGAPELIVITDREKLFVLDWEGEGRFVPRLVAEKQGSDILEVADVDSDGALDVVSIASTGSEPEVLLHRGAGDGGLVPPAALARGLPAPRALSLADRNGDGAVDLVAALGAQQGGLLAILLASAPGNLETREAVPLDAGPRALASVKGEGLQNHILALGTRAVYRLSQAGGGPPESSLVREFTGRALGDIAAQDLDGDGSPEAVVTDLTGGNVLFWPLHGAGEPLDLPAGELPARTAAGDLDGDGKLDLAIADQGSNAVSLLLRPGYPDPPGRAEAEAGSPQRSVALSDLDGDGDLDLAAGARDGLRLLFGDAQGAFPASRALDAARNASDVEAADLDRDGAADLLAATNAGLLAFHAAGRGDAMRESTVLGAAVSAVEAADVDGDGRLDVMAASGEQVLAFRGTGEGFAMPERYLGGAAVSALALADLDGDGALECAVAGPSLWAVTVLRPRGGEPVFRRGNSNSDGAVDLSDAVHILSYLFAGSPEPACLQAADVDGDDGVVITDAIFLLGTLFLGEGPIPPPYPDCGAGPPGAVLGCEGVTGC